MTTGDFLIDDYDRDVTVAPDPSNALSNMLCYRLSGGHLSPRTGDAHFTQAQNDLYQDLFVVWNDSINDSTPSAKYG
eukprot:3058553-Amphidinium_carterae.1